MQKIYIEQIPIPKMSEQEKKYIHSIIDKLSLDYNSILEDELDTIVYRLYKLTPEEIRRVEEN